MKDSNLLADFHRMVQDRIYYDSLNEEVATFFIPSSKNHRLAGMLYKTRQLSNMPPSSTQRQGRRQTGFGIYALNMLTNHMYRMTMPMHMKWHGLVPDAYAMTEDGFIPVEVREFCEVIRDQLFQIRMNPLAGFMRATKAAQRSAHAFGTGVVMVEDGGSISRAEVRESAHIAYKFIPLPDIYLGIDEYGNPYKAYRVVMMTVEQFIDRFGPEKLPERFKHVLDKPGTMDEMIRVIHGVFPRHASEVKNMPGSVYAPKSYSSVYFLPDDGGKVVAKGGYRRFPYIVYYARHSEQSAYGDSTCHDFLDDIRGLNALYREAHVSVQMNNRPPMGTYEEVHRLNLNPNAINKGAIGPDGAQRVRPLITGADLGAIHNFLDRQEKILKEFFHIDFINQVNAAGSKAGDNIMSMYSQFFANMGPIGETFIEANGLLVERELDILFAHGIVNFLREHGISMPEGIDPTTIKMKSSTPFDQIRKADSAARMQAMFGALQSLAQIDPDEVKESIDIPAAIAVIQDSLGVPAVALASEEDRHAKRDARLQAQHQQGQIQNAQGIAAASKDAVPMIQELSKQGVGAQQITQAIGQQQNDQEPQQ